MSASQQDEFLNCYVRFQGDVFAYIATLLPRRQDADEVFSEVSLILWRKWSEYDPTRDFLPWARAIAFNEIRNHLRRIRRKAVTLSDELLAQLADTRELTDETFAARRDALNDCMKGVSRDEQSLLQQCYEGPQTIRQVAKTIGVRESALYMRLHRIRQFLHECIDYRLVDEAG
jgi:RNA polymerase sigma-70 factor (ECF subfamily)